MVTILILIITLLLIVVSLYFLFFKENVHKRVEKAIIMYNEGHINLALKQFNDLALSHKDIPDIYWYLGLIHEKMAVYVAAEQSLEKVLALKRFSEKFNESEVRKFLAKIYFKNNKLDQAFKEYLHVNQLSPDDEEVLFRLGQVSLERKSYRDAIVYFEKFKKNNMNNAEIFYYLGLSYYMMNVNDLAEKNLEKSIDIDPSLTDTHYYMGEIYLNNKNFDMAIKEFELSIASKILKQQTEISMGKCYYNKNFFKQAITYFKQALMMPIEDTNEKCDILYSIADSFSKLGNLDDSIKYYKEVQTFDPEFKDVKDKVAHFETLTGDNVLHSFYKASDDEYINIAKKAVESLNFKVKEHDLSKNGILDVIAQDRTAKVSDNYLIEFIRFESIVGELTLREMQSKMQDMQVNRGICVTTASFTPEAIAYSDKRSIELINKNELVKILKRKNMKGVTNEKERV